MDSIINLIMAAFEENENSKILIHPKRKDALTQIFNKKKDRPIVK